MRGGPVPKRKTVLESFLPHRHTRSPQNPRPLSSSPRPDPVRSARPTFAFYEWPSADPLSPRSSAMPRHVSLIAVPRFGVPSTATPSPRHTFAIISNSAFKYILTHFSTIALRCASVSWRRRRCTDRSESTRDSSPLADIYHHYLTSFPFINTKTNKSRRFSAP